MSIAETWNAKCKYTKYTEGQIVYYYYPIQSIPHRKIRSPFNKAKIIKVYPCDVYMIQLENSGRKLITSYNKITLIPHHIESKNRDTETSDSDNDDDNFENDHFDREDNIQFELSDTEESDSNEEYTNEIPKITLRRSNRERKAIDRYQSKPW